MGKGHYPLACPFAAQGCPVRFRNQNGRTYHVRSVHVNNNAVQPTQQNNTPDRDFDNRPPFNASPSPPLFNSPSPPQSPRSPTPRPIPSSPPPEEAIPHYTRNYHPHLDAQPCDTEGNFLPPGTQPTPRSALSSDDWSPFEDQTQFRMAEFLFRKAEMSGGNIDELMDIWAQSQLDDEGAPFDSHEHMYSIIDSISHGDAPWQSFTSSYTGHIGPNPPSWQLDEYEVCYRDPSTVIKHILDNPSFDGAFEYKPYVEIDRQGKRCWNEFMSANFAWRHADRIYTDDPDTKGSMLCPIILGADKTTVSVATGHVEYHPLYLTIGNIHNTVRRAHRNAVIPIGFLAIPKSDRKDDNTSAFRIFKKQLYHASIAHILKSLRPGMTRPVIRRCPDGHYHKVIYDLAGFIADYPEQVYLAGIVQGWCPRCTAMPNNLDGERGRRTREFTETLLETLHCTHLWDDYGIDGDIVPFTIGIMRVGLM